MHRLLVVLALLGIVVCHSERAFASGVKSSVFSLIMKSLNEEINGKLDAESIEFSPPSTVVFKDVTVHSAHGDEVFTAKKISATIVLGDLFSGQLNFEEIEIFTANFNLRTVNGELNLLSIFKPESPGSPPTYFSKVIVHDSKATYKSDKDTFTLSHADFETEYFDTDFKKVTVKKASAKLTTQKDSLFVDFTGALTTQADSKSGRTILSYLGKITSAQGYSRSISNSDLTANVSFEKNLIRLQGFRLSGSSLNLIAQGSYQTNTDQISLTLNAKTPQTRNFFKELDEKWNLTDAFVRASINGNVKQPLIIADISAKWQDMPLTGRAELETASEKLTGEFKLSSNTTVDLKSITGQSLELVAPTLAVSTKGTLHNLAVKVSTQSSELRLPAQGLALTHLSLSSAGDVDTKTQSFSGSLTLNFDRGSSDKISLSTSQITSDIQANKDLIKASGTLKAAALNSSFLDTDKLEGKFEVSNNEVVLSNFVLAVHNGAIKLSKLSANFQNKKISGHGAVEHIDMNKLLAPNAFLSATDLNAHLAINGTTDRPQITLDGNINGTSLFGSSLGVVDFIANFGTVAKGILQVSAGIDGNNGRATLQTSYDTKSKQINALLDFINVTTDPLLAKLDPWLKFGQSTASGSLELSGPLDNPNALFSVSLNADRADQKLNLLGLNATVELKNHHLSFGACANLFRRHDEFEPCYPAVPIKVKGEGSFKAFNNFSLNYDISLESDSFEKVSDFLKKESIFLDMKLNAKGDLEKRPGQDLKYSLAATVTDLNAVLSNNLPLKLEKPFVFSLANSTIVVDPEAHFLLNDGDFTFKGQFSKQKVDAAFNGRIPLYFARFFNRNIVDTGGVATGNVTLSGSIESPLIKGALTPVPGSYVRLRALPSNIEFESGDLQASFVEGEQGGLVRINIDDLRTKIGNGKLSASGTLDLSRSFEQSNMLKKADVTLIGTDLSILRQHLAIEGGFNLRVVTENGTHWVRGVAEVVSGRVSREFKLEGFELNAEGSTFSKASTLDDMFKPFKLSVDVDLSPFDLQIDFGRFDFIGNLSGNNLHITGNLAQPRIYGDLMLSDGAFRFPAADFEISTVPIALRNTPSKPVDPDIHIKATAELGKDFGLKDNTVVEFSLDGDFDHMHLGLLPSSGEGQLDRQKILAMLLNINVGPEILLRPLFDKVEEILNTQTKTRFRIGSTISEQGPVTALDWRLNPRLEIGGSWSTSQLGLQDVHFKLKLFDHLPIGKELSLEGIFKFISDSDKGQTQNLQLNYRLFEK